MLNEWRLETHRDRLLNDANIGFKFYEEEHRYTDKNKTD